MNRMAMISTAVLLTACASAPRAPAFDPVGTYDFTTDVQGTSISGVLTLRRTEQGLTGSFMTPMSGEVALDGVTIDGRKLTLRARVPDGEVVMNLDFAADYRFTGNWALSSGVGGNISGSRRRPAP